jgi:RNA polymerase sigma-70 factor (ECF subfamily)
MEDHELTEYAVRSAEGDTEAAESLILALHHHLFALVHVMGVPDDDVEDTAQDIMLQVFRSLSRYDPAKPFKPWFRSIARHVVQHYWRDREYERRKMDRFQRYVAESYSTEDSVGELDDIRRSRLDRCIERLKERQREILDLFYTMQLNCGDIGACLGLKPQTVRMSLCRIRDALRACVEKGAEA